MKIKWIVSTLLFFSATAAADLVTPEQHMEWEKQAFEECTKHSLMNKQLRCLNDATDERRKAGLLRGTVEYVNNQYANLTDEQVLEQIRIAEKTREGAPLLSQHTDIGELTTNDYLFEIIAAKTLLQKRALDRTKNAE